MAEERRDCLIRTVSFCRLDGGDGTEEIRADIVYVIALADAAVLAGNLAAELSLSRRRAVDHHPRRLAVVSPRALLRLSKATLLAICVRATAAAAGDRHAHDAVLPVRQMVLSFHIITEMPLSHACPHPMAIHPC
ncbi:hypothetical protein B296_00032901, partial [Ensete ventricosum]